MKPIKTLVLITSTMASAPVWSEQIDSSDRFFDKKLEKYVYVCSEENGALMVGESCGKFWEKFPRKREEIVKEVKEYKELKKYDKVMIPIKKNGEVKWTLATVAFMYEDGTIQAFERYTNPGPSGGAIHYALPYSSVSKVKTDSAFKDLTEVCVKEDFEILFSPSDKKSYKFEKGEKLDVKQVFENGMMAVSYQGFFKNFFSYGSDNKLPIDSSKVEACSEVGTNSVDDSKRDIKPAQVHEEAKSAIESDAKSR